MEAQPKFAGNLCVTKGAELDAELPMPPPKGAELGCGTRVLRVCVAQRCLAACRYGVNFNNVLALRSYVMWCIPVNVFSIKYRISMGINYTKPQASHHTHYL